MSAAFRWLKIGTGGGALLEATGVGAPVGAMVQVVSVSVLIQGVTSGARTINNALHDPILNKDANPKDAVFGKTRIGSRNNPTGSVETDLTDGTLTAKFKKDGLGSWNLDTMFPEPK